MGTTTSTGSAAAPDEGYKLGYTIAICLTAALGGFLFGFDSGVINGTVDGLQQAFQSNSVGTGFSVASMLLGSAIGAFFAGRLSDLFGRRGMMIVAAILFVISAYGSGIAMGTTEFVIYRLIGGLAVGAASVLAPAYIAEIAPARYRGGLATLQQVAIIVGLTAAFLSNYFLAQVSGSAMNEFWWGFETWRWMFWMEIIPATIFLLALMAIPESPRVLVLRRQVDSARKVLERLSTPQNADNVVSEIEDSVAADHKARFSDLLLPGTKQVAPIVWVGIGLAVFQQLVGINVVFYYGAVLWQSVGFTEQDALLINVLSGTISIIAVAITIAVVDKIGRKPLIVFGSAGMAITLGMVAFAFSQGTLTEDGLDLPDNMGVLALVAANLYVFIFNMSWGPVMWVLLGEMFPNRMRGSGLAVAGFFQWIANFGITMTFPILLTGIGLAAAYGIYAFFAAVSLVFAIYLVRETKQRVLEEMTS